MNLETEYCKLYNEDCILGSKRISDNSIDLMICDPPFGINESSFNKYYKRDPSNVIEGYVEAPLEYYKWTHDWLSESKRILKDNGSMYIIMGHSNLHCLLDVLIKLNFYVINHLIWKYNFGVYTKNKFVTSHYHILYVKKSHKSSVKFNTFCRFGQQEKDENNKSLLFKDMEDVFVINKDFSQKTKNQNKLPDELINKLILYSSDPNDIICDFFMGNFTTAYSAIGLGRKVIGFEKNKNSFDYHIPLIQKINFGGKLNSLKIVENICPPNQGKTVSLEEYKNICLDYELLSKKGEKMRNISLFLQNKYGRGKFSIKNILDKYKQSK